ncbi:MAG: STAS domain-containing protein, partial [Cyanobacteria bacterium J06638_6]
RTYSVSGQIFFVSVDDFLAKFDFHEELEKVTLNFFNAHIWDQSAVAAVDQVVINFRRNGAEVEILGLNEASATLIENLSTYDNPDALDKIAGH